MTIIPMRDLKDTVAIEKRCAEANGPVFVTKNGYGRLVVMDIEYYEQTMGKIYEAKLINEGLSDLKNGKVTEGDAFRARMTEKYGV
ncbi:MAG: type II toxin-antitoxin system Phd/YefM family antitoxin [Christensenellaceae bacterium]